MKNQLALTVVAPILLVGSLSTYAATTSTNTAAPTIKADSRLTQISNQLKTAQTRWTKQLSLTASFKYAIQYQNTISSTMVDGFTNNITVDRSSPEPLVTVSGLSVPFTAVTRNTDMGTCNRPAGTTTITALELGQAHDIDSAFALIQAAINKKVARLDVTFDSTMGYPTSIYIDPNPYVNCDDATVKISGFERMTLAQLDAQRRQMANTATSNLSKWKTQKTKASQVSYTTLSVANTGLTKNGAGAQISEKLYPAPASVNIQALDMFPPNIVLDDKGNPVDLASRCDASLKAGANVVTDVKADGLNATVGIENAFALIQTALKNKVARLDVQYDPTLGYPTSIYIDRSATRVCDDITFNVKDMVYTPKSTKNTTQTNSASTLTILK